jgi:hypothetical protein
MIRVSFEAKAPYDFWCPQVEYDKDSQTEGEALVKKFNDSGWKTFARVPMAFGGVEKVGVSKHGSGLFGGWTKEEQTVNVKEARAIFKEAGFTKVEKNKLTYRDLL